MSVVQVPVLAIVAILVNQLKNGRSLALLGVSSAGWMWVLLYAYSLRIYFDFSGYTDIAGHAVADEIPVLLVNEPILVANGLHSDVRYNDLYIRAGRTISIADTLQNMHKKIPLAISICETPSHLIILLIPRYIFQWKASVCLLKISTQQYFPWFAHKFTQRIRI